jgi:hypothetical protein
VKVNKKLEKQREHVKGFGYNQCFVYRFDLKSREKCQNLELSLVDRKIKSLENQY